MPPLGLTGTLDFRVFLGFFQTALGASFVSPFWGQGGTKVVPGWGKGAKKVLQSVTFGSPKPDFWVPECRKLPHAKT